MKVIYNRLIPLPGFKAINLCGVLIARTGTQLTPIDLTHEAIHSCQIRELWFVGFYILYLWQWLRGLIQGISSHEAYRRMPLEQEAYDHEKDDKYLLTRPRMAWRQYSNDWL